MRHAESSVSEKARLPVKMKGGLVVAALLLVMREIFRDSEMDNPSWAFASLYSEPFEGI
jgi:hypothetical protein